MIEHIRVPYFDLGLCRLEFEPPLTVPTSEIDSSIPRIIAVVVGEYRSGIEETEEQKKAFVRATETVVFEAFTAVVDDGFAFALASIQAQLRDRHIVTLVQNAPDLL